MDPISRLQAGVAQAATVMDGVQTSDYRAATPCDGWDVEQLMNHMVSALVMFRDVATNGEADPAIFAADQLGGDPAGSLRAAGAAAVAGWSTPGKIDEMANLPFGTMPAAFALGLPAMDMLVHSWDLATATGQAVSWNEELVGSVWEFSESTFSDPKMRGSDFGPPVEVPADADQMTRLVGFLGRSA